LSGFIIKVGAWGIFQGLTFLQQPLLAGSVMGAAVISLCLGTVRLIGQRDLKRMIAFMTIVETNWLVCCLAIGHPAFVSLAFFITAVHAITTAFGFFFVELVSRRFQQRDWTQISGLYVGCPTLFLSSLALLLLLTGFPGTPLFFAKVIFLTFF
jgi:multicomponent K+:H+ antiporter subunit D